MNQEKGPSSAHFVSSTISLSTFNFVTMALGLAGTIILTRHLSTEDYGFYVFILVLVSFIDQISTLGLEMSIQKFIAGAKDESTKEQFFSTGVIMRVAAILLASLVAWFGRPLLEMLFGKSLLPSLLIYLPLIYALDSFQSYLQSVLQGCFRFSAVGMINLITSVVYFIILLALVYGVNGNVTWILLAKAFTSLIAIILAFVLIPIKKKFSFQPQVFKELIKFGSPLQVNDILTFFFQRIDSVVVAAFLGPADLALYEVARKIPDNLRGLYNPFISVYFPFISKRYDLDSREHASDLLNDAVRFVAFVTLLGTAIAILFGQAIIQFLFSGKYVSSAPIFALLMFNLSISLISNVMGTTLVGVGDPQKPMIINSFNAVISWLACVLLIPVYALLGAAAGNTLGTMVAYPLNQFFLRRKINLKDAAHLKPIALFCFWGILVYWVRPDSLLMKISLLAVFLLASVLLSIVTRDDIARLVNGSGINAWRPFQELKIWITKR